MSDKLKLAADTRTQFGKGFARRARAAGKIPAVLYGHGGEPAHVLLPGHQTMMALKHQNALFTITVEGGEAQLAIAKDVQRDPVTQVIEHIDLLLVRKGEKITVDVSVHIVGESYPGTIHILEIGSLLILAEATNLPDSIVVSIEGLEDGAKILAGEIPLPEGSELAGDPEQLIAAITVPRQSAEDDQDEEEVLAEAAAQAIESAEGAE